MKTAEVVAVHLPNFCPITNLYRCSDGRYLLVTLPSMDVAGTLVGLLGIHIPIATSHLPAEVDIFLADEKGTVLDADGDPANGMTPLARVPDVDTHEAALAAIGYRITP